ncbi:MAG TPA: PAS domain S-box protein [Sulfurovum sp.]|nr:PAS domain S-box protein [Sulfurovum sp.]
MRKKVYKLSDIEKTLTYIPPLFIFILAILSMFISYFIMEYRQNSKIELLTQEQRFVNEGYLNRYINSVNLHIKDKLLLVEKELKRSVHTLDGISMGLSLENNISKLQPFIKQIEKENNINFVIFDKDMQVLYGIDIAKSIQHLIFNQKEDKKLLEITLLYISSQGKSSSMSWKNDISKTIQLSHFEKSADGELFVGAFSSVDDLRSLTSKAFVSAISEDLYEPKGYYFWLHDDAEKKIFNKENNKKWNTSPRLDSLSLYHTIDRYFISVGISEDIEVTSTAVGKNIDKIKTEYSNKKVLGFVIIFFVGLVLVLFTMLFSSFVKDIFGAYNRRAERKNQQIHRLKERYELAVIASNDGLWDTNFKTKKTFFSKKWLQMLGYEFGDINSYEDWFGLIHEDDREQVTKAFNAHMHDDKSGHLICEYRLKTKEGSYIWILGRGKVFLDSDDNPLRLSMMSMDIDEKKEASKKLTALVQKEVAKNQEKQKLLIQQNKLAAMGEMIGAIAHQWRQPLNNISLIIHFIRDNVGNKEFIDNILHDYVERAKKQITYMSETIDDFRDFYKPSKTKEVFNVKEAIEATLSIMQTQIDKNKIEVALYGDSLFVDSYENEFKQAILNILSNAKDAILTQKEKDSSFDGKIVINICQNSITLYNNGGYASVEVLERMFEPYFTTKFENKGTGIGLYMTKTIIENNMNGELKAENIDDGVIFTIDFLSIGGLDD